MLSINEAINTVVESDEVRAEIDSALSVLKQHEADELPPYIVDDATKTITFDISLWGRGILREINKVLKKTSIPKRYRITGDISGRKFQ